MQPFLGLTFIDWLFLFLSLRASHPDWRSPGMPVERPSILIERSGASRFPENSQIAELPDQQQPPVVSGGKTLSWKKRTSASLEVPDGIPWNREHSSPPGPAQMADFPKQSEQYGFMFLSFSVVYYITVNNWYALLAA